MDPTASSEADSSLYSHIRLFFMEAALSLSHLQEPARGSILSQMNSVRTLTPCLDYLRFRLIL
jgi:hypothetical protein